MESDNVLKPDSVSAVVLTQGLRDELKECLLGVAQQEPAFSRIIVVINSNVKLDLSFLGEFKNNIFLLSLGGNFGTSARNAGAALAKGEFILFIDDDIVLSQRDTVTKVANILSRPNAPSTICFKVVTKESKDFQPLSWGHPRDQFEWQDKTFETDCITEGAFAIDSRVFKEVGGFWPGIFIGQEDIDLFLRLLRVGARVEYDPNIQCVHLHSLNGRQPLRGFYHYARSDILIAWRNLSYSDTLLFLFKCYLMLFLQAIRSFNPLAFVYIMTGFVDGVCWIIGGTVQRNPIDQQAKSRWNSIRSYAPTIWKRFWKHLTQKNL